MYYIVRHQETGAEKKDKPGQKEQVSSVGVEAASLCPDEEWPEASTSCGVSLVPGQSMVARL